MNSPTSITEIELAVKILPTKKTPRSDGFTWEFYQTLKEYIISLLQKFPDNSRGRYTSHFILWGRNESDTKHKQANKQKPETRDVTRKVNYRPKLNYRPKVN